MDSRCSHCRGGRAFITRAVLTTEGNPAGKPCGRGFIQASANCSLSRKPLSWCSRSSPSNKVSEAAGPSCKNRATLSDRRAAELVAPRAARRDRQQPQWQNGKDKWARPAWHLNRLDQLQNGAPASDGRVQLSGFRCGSRVHIGWLHSSAAFQRGHQGKAMQPTGGLVQQGHRRLLA